MKELSIEEKAKAYDEAKARMSRAFNSNRCTISFMNEIFPELEEESEDERISKEIIKYLEQTVPHNHRDEVLKSKEWIAWLEKQGEQKPQRMVSAEAKEAMYNKPAWSEEDEVYLNTTIAYLKDAKEFKKTAENCIDWLKKLKQRIGGKQ